MQITNSHTIESAAVAENTSAPSVPPQGSGTALPAEHFRHRPDLLIAANQLSATFQECRANSVGWLIQSGACLRDRRNQLLRDEWVQILRSGKLPVGTRTAQMLIRIASHPALNNQQNLKHLPNAISILNALASVPASVVQAAISTGVINPDMLLETAQQIVEQFHGKTKPEEDSRIRLI